MDTCTACVLNLCFINGLGFIYKADTSSWNSVPRLIQWISYDNLSFLYTSIYLFWGVKNDWLIIIWWKFREKYLALTYM